MKTYSVMLWKCTSIHVEARSAKEARRIALAGGGDIAWDDGPEEIRGRVLVVR